MMMRLPHYQAKQTFFFGECHTVPCALEMKCVSARASFIFFSSPCFVHNFDVWNHHYYVAFIMSVVILCLPTQM